MLQALMGQSRLLARPGDWRLWLLNAQAAGLWDWHQAGLDDDTLVTRLAQHYGLAVNTARQQWAIVRQDWLQSGLLSESVPDPEEAVWMNEHPAPAPAVWPADTLTLRLADCTLGLWIEEGRLRQALWPLINPLHSANQEPQGPLLSLRGDANDWQWQWNDQTLQTGQGLDEAVITVIRELTERACRAHERLLVVHGAGLVGPDKTGVLLIAPGGSGKTTLAAALNADGFPLLHDDVVPVDRDGHLLGLGLPITLKAGSWPVLQSRRSDLMDSPVRQRLGQPVRLLSPINHSSTGPIRLGALIFPRYQPGQPPNAQQLSPEATLQGLIEAEAVIRHLTQDKLERLARWVESAPAWSLSYPDLDSGLAGVRAILAPSDAT